jgi:hypothetical protein
MAFRDSKYRGKGGSRLTAGVEKDIFQIAREPESFAGALFENQRC